MVAYLSFSRCPALDWIIGRLLCHELLRVVGVTYVVVKVMESLRPQADGNDSSALRFDKDPCGTRATCKSTFWNLRGKHCRRSSLTGVRVLGDRQGSVIMRVCAAWGQGVGLGVWGEGFSVVERGRIITCGLPSEACERPLRLPIEDDM